LTLLWRDDLSGDLGGSSVDAVSHQKASPPLDRPVHLYAYGSCTVARVERMSMPPLTDPFAAAPGTDPCRRS
jgi:hypothetical protein